jgi:hypothetical protein
MADQSLLSAAECFAELSAVVGLAFGWIGAELEGTAMPAVGSRLGGCRHADASGRVEGRSVSGEARRQVIPVGAAQTTVAVAGLHPAFGKVQQQEDIGDKLLRARVECSPPG